MRTHGALRRIVPGVLILTMSFGGGVEPVTAQSPALASSPPVADAFVMPTSRPVPADTEISADAGLQLSDVPPAPPATIDLLAIERRATAQADAMPAQDWSIGALADALEDDPMAAYAFVRDSISFDPYRGTLRGAQGTLAARAGNAADRALLLQALLDRMGMSTHLAFGSLDDPTAARLVARSFASPARPLALAPLDAAEATTAGAIVLRARRDYARLRGTLGDRVSAMDGSGDAAALADVRSHVWVQMRFGTRWLDLDPSFPDSQAGASLTTATSVADAIPDTERQVVVVTVLAETLSDGHLEVQPVLEHRFDAATDGGKDIYLTFQPEIGALGGDVSEALGSATAWQPALYIGSDDVALGTPFPVRPATDILSGTKSGPVVSALRLEVSIEAPGSAPTQVSRTLLDRVPRALRGASVIDEASLEPMAVRDGIIAALGALHHVQISTGGLSERDHAIWRGIAADFTGAVMLDESRLSSFAMPAALLPLTVADEALALDSERLIRHSMDVEADVRAFVARPRVFISSIGPAPGEPGIVVDTDLLSDGVRILTTGARGPADAAERQLWYGALEGALETQLGLERAASGDPGTLRPSSTSLDLGPVLVVLDPTGLGRLPPTAEPGLADDLRRGQLAVVGSDLAKAHAWWTVDPRTGIARAVLASGLGGYHVYENHTPSGRGIDVSKIVDKPETYDYQAWEKKFYQDEVAAATRAAPQQVCFFGNEETALFCVSQTAFRTFVVIGIGVGVIVIIAVIALV